MDLFGSAGGMEPRVGHSDILYIRRLRPFLFKILNFNIVWGIQKNEVLSKLLNNLYL